MNRSHVLCLLLAASSLSLAACNKKEETPAPAASEATTATPAPVAAAPAVPAEPVVDVASLPVEEQYEADAETEITPDNVQAKLDELEKEIAAP
jgi:hypothetical protein